MKQLFLWPLALLALACQPSANHDTERIETSPPPAAKQKPSGLPDADTASGATASSGLPAGFRAALATGRMTFRPPAGTVPTSVLKNAQMDYEYAVRVPGKHVEIRYAIRPLGQLLAEYQQAKAKGEAAVDPNQLYSSLVTVVALNVSGGDEPTTEDFPAEAVQREFGADWGTTTMVRAGKEFGPKYAKCMIVALHKQDVADAYCFYLFDKPDDLGPLLDSPTTDAFHALRFR